MTAAAGSPERVRGRGIAGLRLARHRGLIVAVGVFAAIFVLLDLLVPGPVSYFEVSFLVSGSTPLALAAMGETMVIFTAGLAVMLLLGVGSARGGRNVRDVLALLFGEIEAERRRASEADRSTSSWQPSLN